MSSIDPSPSYGAFPLTDFPEPGDDNDIDQLKTFIDDAFNRIVYIKEAQDADILKMTNSETQTGFDFSTADLPVWASGTVDLTGLTTKGSIEAINTYLSTLISVHTNIANNVGGGVTAASTPVYDTPKYLVDGDSHHTSLEKLDEQIYDTTTSLNTVSPTITENKNRIDNIVDKISDTADQAGTGLNYDSTNFVSNGDKIDAAIGKLDKPTMANRRVGERNFIQTLYNWRDISFGEAGGSSPDAYFYDSLYNDNKINAANSTSLAYDNVDQSFGRSDITWKYFSEIQALPAGTNTIKMRWNGSGTVSPQINFQGSFVAGFVDITAQDTWTAIPAGTQLVVKFDGAVGAKLYDYTLLYKTV